MLRKRKRFIQWYFEEYRLRDDNDIGGFSWPKSKIAMYKLAIEHNTLHFSCAKDLAVSCLFFYYFRVNLSQNVEKTIAILVVVF